MTIQEQIDARVKTANPGTLFFVNDFSEFDNVYVSKILPVPADMLSAVIEYQDF